MAEIDKLTVVIPALNAETVLPSTLNAVLEEGDDLVAEVIVVDGGSADGTCQTAAACDARVLSAPRGRGQQLRAGGEAAGTNWLLFLHADTRLQPGWVCAVQAFVQVGENRDRVAVFRFGLDDPNPAARRVERLVAWRNRVFGLPYGDQALLVHRARYDRIGGFRPMPLFEDVDIVRRLGRSRITVLEATAVTSSERFQRDGWWMRPLRNLSCLTLYFLGVPPRVIARLYG